MEKLINCKVCGAEIAKSAKACPKCGAKQKKNPLLIVCAVFFGLAFIGTVFGPKDTKPQKPQVPPQNNQQSTVIQDTSKSEETPAQPAVPQEYLNALSQAQTYSDKMHMSKQGIFDQLTSEYGGQFPIVAAQYAIDNLEADYKANALETAKVYYEKMNMSKEDVRDQLTSAYGARFTQEEADYAIDQLN